MVVAFAGAAWLLEPVVMHSAAQAIRAAQGKSGETSANEPGIWVGNPAPDFTLEASDGSTRHLSDYRGKVVVLNFWATWCGPCKYEIPWFIGFQKEYAARGFTVVGISMDDTGWKVVRPFMAEHQMNYPVLLGDEAVNKSYLGIEALPTTLVLGKDGKIAFLHTGLIGQAEYRAEIESLLKSGA